jgi:hypothetical protein
LDYRSLTHIVIETKWVSIEEKDQSWYQRSSLKGYSINGQAIDMTIAGGISR